MFTYVKENAITIIFFRINFMNQFFLLEIEYDRGTNFINDVMNN
jgi:hypothetical protein